nr:MAG TPA: hypothetical protein [Caudoviricetes sp.]
MGMYYYTLILRHNLVFLDVNGYFAFDLKSALY